MKKLTTSALLLSVWLCSCTHYYYVPNVQNVPLFKEKNEFRLSGAFGGGDVSTSIDLQAAFSISDHIGMITNYLYAYGGDASKNDWGKGSYFEGALGYYKTISKYGVFEIYGGLGGSNQQHQYSVHPWGSGSYTSTGTSDLSFTKLFVQPSLGLTLKGLDIAFSTRLCNLSFNKIDNQINRQTDESEYNNLNSIAQNKRYMFLEPAITLRVGLKNIKVQVQAAFSSYLNSDLYFERAHISFGLYFNIVQKPGEIVVY